MGGKHFMKKTLTGIFSFLRSNPKMNYAWVILAILLTYVLIMILSAGQSVWFDEGYSILLAKRPVGALIALTGVDAHPPLFYLLLKGWAGIFGWSDFALRSMSAIFASLTVGAVFLLVRRLFTVRTALVTLPFLVIAPFALRYGYEIRMYALAGLIGAVASLVLVYARASTGKKLWVLYAVLVALGMFTLYMTAAIWVTHVVWLFFTTKRRKFLAFFKQPWVLSYVGAVILFAVYLPTLFYQLTHSALPGIGGSITLTKLADISGLLLLFTPEWQLTSIVSFAILAVIVLMTCLLVSSMRALPKAERLNLWFVIFLVVVPLLFFTLTSLAKPIFVDRYMAHVAIYFYMLIGVTVALGWRYGRRLAAGSLAAISLVLLFFGVFQLQQTGNFIFERLQHPQTMQLRSDITCNRNTTIVADDPYTYIDTNYYFGGCDLRFFSEQPVVKQGGYAPLFDSTARVTSSNEISSQNLIHLGWNGATPAFKVDARYTHVRSATYEQQVVDYYTLKTE
jgi:mannosyltransferase